jgi:adenine-specific DNA-methyltransferase
LADLLKAKPELIQSVWQALKAIEPEALTGEGRVYGGELYKMETKELGNVSAESIVSLLPTMSLVRGAQVTLW